MISLYRGWLNLLEQWSISPESTKLNQLVILGSPVELVRAFGKKEDFEAAIKELERELCNNIA